MKSGTAKESCLQVQEVVNRPDRLKICEGLDYLSTVITLTVSRKLFTYGAGQEKTDLKVFVVVMPKEGWARVAAPTLLLA